MNDYLPSILIIEDEPNLGETLKDYLTSIGHTTYWAKDCKEAKIIFESKRPFIILIDIGLTDGDGRELAAHFRSLRKDFYFIFLSAQNDPQTRVSGLELGAEDYITKPFALKELTLRLERILKMNESRKIFPNNISIGPLKIRLQSFEVEDAYGEIIPLSQKECAILELLLTNNNRAITRDEIINHVWGHDAYPSNRTVDNYIVKLRKWVDTDSLKSLEIQSIRGIGYKLVKKELNYSLGDMHGTI